jgi:hypothetical protein
VSDERLRVVTEEQRERFHTARNQGGMCAACGRTLQAAEAVYHEQFFLGVKRLPKRNVTVYASASYGPVGAECASPELLQQTDGVESEQCAGCGRPVYYRSTRSARGQALCSRRCGRRVALAKLRKARAEG